MQSDWTVALMPVGDVFRMTSWAHVEPTMRLTFKVGDKRQGAVMLLLGYENKDGARRSISKRQ